MNDKVRKVLRFLTFWEAMSSRNITSILLVVFFMGVYVAAGGKITTLPKLDKNKAGFNLNSSGGSGELSITGDVEETSEAELSGEDELSPEGTDSVKPAKRMRFDRSEGESIGTSEVKQPDATDRYSEIERKLRNLRGETE